MNKNAVILFCIIVCIVSTVQAQFERRLIIEKDSFYAVEIDNATQLAKLYHGSMSDPLDKAVVYGLPAGTKRVNNHNIPFAWDIAGDTLYCINYTEYAQNSHIRSLKCIALKDLHIFDPAEKPMERLLQAAYANQRIWNMPLVQTYSQYTYMDDLYFDLKFSDDVLYEIIHVKGGITVWAHNAEGWKHSETIPFHTLDYFSTFTYGNSMHIVSAAGDYLDYPAMINMNPDVVTPLAGRIIVEDRNNGKVFFLDQSIFDDRSKTLEFILEQTIK